MVKTLKQKLEGGVEIIYGINNYKFINNINSSRFEE